MKRVALLVFVCVVFMSLPVTAEDFVSWIAIAAHSEGEEGSTWRTDVAILNPCPYPATIEIRLNADGASESAFFEIPAARQQIFNDIVDQIIGEEGAGSLEIHSDQEIVVTSRTYNLAADGSTFGQALPGLVKKDGIDEDESARLLNLRHDDAFRTNFGIVSMDDEAATATLSLYDTAGDFVGDIQVSVPAGEVVTVNSPYERSFGRSDIAGGFALLKVDDGKNLWAYASVVDRLSNDPTTVKMLEAGQDCSAETLLDDYFSLLQIHSISIDVGQDGYQSLLDEPRTYVRASVTIDGWSFQDVGVRLKGGAGSFVALDGTYPEISGDGNGNPGKSAMILDFNRFVDKQSFLGLEKLTLNNLVQDPSGIHEYLGYSMWREAGVPASRTAWATIELNGVDKGLYLSVESPDNSEFLERWFGNDNGNLYEGEYGADLRSDRVEWFDQDNGSDETKKDLSQLASQLDSLAPGDDPTTLLDQHFAFDTYLQYAATELFLAHWDGYAWSANNYFVIHDLDSEQWTFMPWGADQLFVDEMGPYRGVMQGFGPSWSEHGGRIHALCVESAQCRGRLHQAFEDVLDRVDSMNLLTMAQQARDLVEPLLLAEANAYGDPTITTAAFGTVDAHIQNRPGEIREWLGCLNGESVDHDGDGFNACTVDCDDFNPEVHPGASEECNFVDDDCNGIIDDPANCPDCLEHTVPAGESFSLCFKALPWTDARAACQSQGSDLASIHDLDTTMGLADSMMAHFGAERAWIGLNDRRAEGHFEWSDGTDFDFSAWSSDSPKPEGDIEDCVFNAFWGWSDIGCADELPYVCN